MASSLKLPAWPDNARVAVSLTFDVDTDSVWRGMLGPAAEDRLGLLSQSRFGAVRGLPRVLSLLAERDLPATFFVPGRTALEHPETVPSILAEGHEIGHHGFDHLPPHEQSPERQRDEITRGLEVLATHGVRPTGYRAPCAELTPATLKLLVEHGFLYDSSCAGDDRPYLEEFGENQIIELPMDWRLDDAVYMMFTLDFAAPMRDPASVLEEWWQDYLFAKAERTHLNLVMHPEVIGRGSRISRLAELVDRMADSGETWFARLNDVAELVALPTHRLR